MIVYKYGLLEGQCVAGLEAKFSRLAIKLGIILFTIETCLYEIIQKILKIKKKKH